jgi:hypothetical protein
MPSNELPALPESNRTARATDEQEGGTRRLQSSSLAGAEYEEIAEAFRRFGFDSVADGLRMTSLCFARNEEVRRMIAKAIPGARYNPAA